jgi:hypothetical protein
MAEAAVFALSTAGTYELIISISREVLRNLARFSISESPEIISDNN